MEIRYALLTDIDKINELRKKLNDMHLVLNDIFKDNIESAIIIDTNDILKRVDTNIICAVCDDVVGYAIFTENHIEETYDRYSKNIYHITELYVDENYKGKGVGTQIIEFIKLEAKKNKINRIELDVYTFNEKAINFYEKKGFTEYKRYLGIDI